MHKVTENRRFQRESQLLPFSVNARSSFPQLKAAFFSYRMKVTDPTGYAVSDISVSKTTREAKSRFKDMQPCLAYLFKYKQIF